MKKKCIHCLLGEKNMKIVFLTPIYLPHIGGIEIYVHDLAQELFKKGHKIVVITADDEINECTTKYIDGETIIRIPTKSYAGLCFLRNTIDYHVIDYQLERADIVHVNDCKFLFSYCAHKKKKYGYRLLASSHGWVFHTRNHFMIKKLYFKYIIAKKAIYFDKIICVSDQDKRIAEKYHMTHNVIVILNGADLLKYGNLKLKNFFEYKFIYWGRISPNKGIYECLKKLEKLSVDYSFSVIGACDDEIYMRKIKLFLLKHKMDNKVYFYGRLSDQEIRKLIEESDIILMPSLYEGFGFSLVESLSTNKIIIANRNESFAYILKAVGAEDSLFDFEDEKNDILNKVEQLRNKRLIPVNIEQFSKDNMICETMKVILNIKQ